MIKKVIIIGGGRMGMSHYSTIQGLYPDIEMLIVERSMLMRLILSRMGFNVFSRVPFSQIPGNAVLITTGTGSHFSVASEVAKHGPARVFVEKPLTSSAEHSKALVELYEPLDVISQVGFVYRYQSRFSDFKEHAITPEIGGSYDLIFLNSVMSSPNRTWRAYEEKGGGVLNDFGSHALDLVTYLYGDILSIEDVQRARTSSVDTEDIVSFTTKHKNCSGRILLDWTDTSVRKTTVTLKHGGDAGTFIVDENGLQKNGAKVDLGVEQVGFYLRGNEFSKQMADFVTGQYGQIGASFRCGAQTDELIQLIKLGALKNGY